MDKWKDDEQIYNEENYSLNIDEDEDEDFLIEREQTIIKQLDPDILQYFDEAKILNRKSPIAKSKKRKKDKFCFQAGQKVRCNNQICSIIYGPYEKDTKIMYELETGNGEVISAEFNDIKQL